jgi:hypothetical protein
MPTLRTPDDFRLNLHRAATDASRWWSRRPWADAMTIVDTAAYVPGRHNAAPLMRSTRKPRRARRDDPDMTWFHVRPALLPATRTARRVLDALGAGYRSLQLPATVRLVPDAEAERLAQARRGIAFRPRNGFLASTPLRRLPRDA